MKPRRGHSSRVERIIAAMGRWLFRVWLSLSLLLLVACGMAWVRGLWWQDSVSYLAASGTQFRLCTQPHALQLSSCTNADASALVDELRRKRGWSTASHRWHTEQTYSSATTDSGSGWIVVLIHEPAKMEHSFLGFGWDRQVYSNGPLPPWRPNRVTSETLALMVPIWFIMLVLSIAPLVATRHRLRLRRRRKNGLCTHCGYDLRATPDRCPECGREAASP